MLGKALGSRGVNARRKEPCDAHPSLAGESGPDEITVLTSAFDDALRKLRLADRADPATEVVARKIIELAQQGERDPTRLSERAIQALTSVRARVIP